jgi:glutamate N-acetyltransferase / amino-acid N-acetyltransferase
MSRPRKAPLRFDLPQGFRFSAVSAGIKPSGRPDLALVECSPGTRAAAVFTRNLVAAAPVHVGRRSLVDSRGRVRAVIVNSGNANCATGRLGIRDCEAVCREVANILGVSPKEVFPASTGIIGVPLPVKKLVAKLPDLVSQQQATEDAAQKFAEAILTTDTRIKVSCQRFAVKNRAVTVLGMAKGSGMIHPRLATMLVYLFADLRANPRELRRFLQDACHDTFNCISVDGDTSTNDTVLLLASGQSGVGLGVSRVAELFRKSLGNVCRSLAEQVVSDGEGVQRVIELIVEQAQNRDEALEIARSIATSALVKTAWAGADPNWGRILAAIGRSGVPVDPNRIDIWIGSQQACRQGEAHSFNKKEAHRHLSQSRCEVKVRLHRGRSQLRFLTTDLTAEYVHINADYST